MINDINNVNEQMNATKPCTPLQPKNEVQNNLEDTTPMPINQPPSMVMGDKPVNFIERLFDLIFKHGLFKSVCAILMIIICVMLWQFVTALNYEKIAEKVVQDLVAIQKIEKREHEEGAGRRKENNEKITSLLIKSIYELGADRAAVLEMHNGKENPTGLPFVYCDMTYEETRDRTPYISDEYSDMNMGKYHFFNYIINERLFFGSFDEIWGIDKKFAIKVEINDAEYIAMIVVRNDIEIGFFVVSFLKTPTIDEHVLKVKLNDYAQQLGFLLDMTPALKSKN